MKKSLALLTLGAWLLCPGLAGAAPKNPAGTTDIEIHERSKSDLLMSILGGKLQQKAMLKGFRVLFFDSGDNFDLQLGQLETHLRPGLAVVVRAVDITRAQELVDVAKAKGNIIVFVNLEPAEGVIESYDKAWFVGGDPYDGGRIQSEQVVNYVKKTPSFDQNGNGVLDIMLLRGPQWHPDANIREESLKKALEEAGIKYSIADECAGEYNYEVGFRHMREVIAADKYKDLDVVVAQVDDLAIGAIRAVEISDQFRHGKIRMLPTFGVDGTPEAEVAVYEGIMEGTSLHDSGTIADVCLSILTGRDSPEELSKLTPNPVKPGVRRIYVPYVPLTYETRSEFETQLRRSTAPAPKK